MAPPTYSSSLFKNITRLVIKQHKSNIRPSSPPLRRLRHIHITPYPSYPHIPKARHFSTTHNTTTMTGNVWFIAGASNGFGRAIGLEALRHGDHVVATSRNPAKMADLQEAGALVLALDVTSDDATIQAALQKAVDAYGKITHCINAAGYLLEAVIEEAS